MTKFRIKQGDLDPPLKATLQDYEKQPALLAGASVRFHMRKEGLSTVKVDADATVTAPGEGKVEYVWGGDDTDTKGQYEGEFEVTYSNGSIETFPNDGYIQIEVVDDIA